MATILDDINVYTSTNMIRTALNSVNLATSTTEIKGQSDALNKFRDSYEAFDKAVSAYNAALKMDLFEIDLLVNEKMENDKKQSELFTNSSELFNTYVTP